MNGPEICLIASILGKDSHILISFPKSCKVVLRMDFPFEIQGIVEFSHEIFTIKTQLSKRICVTFSNPMDKLSP